MNLSLSGGSVLLGPLGLCSPILPSQGLLVIQCLTAPGAHRLSWTIWPASPLRLCLLCSELRRDILCCFFGGTSAFRAEGCRRPRNRSTWKTPANSPRNSVDSPGPQTDSGVPLTDSYMPMCQESLVCDPPAASLWTGCHQG